MKDLTNRINFKKSEIDKLKTKLEKKEEERRMQNKVNKNDLKADGFDDEDNQEEIIDEEELVFLKDMKDSKRDYRENYSKLKGLKQELMMLQTNIDTAKEQIIYQFENWYIEEFEPFETSAPEAEAARVVASAG